MTSIAANIRHIYEQIKHIQEHHHMQPTQVELVAVSKHCSVPQIEEAIAAGQRVFGENRVQEAMQKWPDLKRRYPDVKLHLIGPLQTNKVKESLELFDVIEVVDRPRLVEVLAKYDPCEHRPVTFFVQVNTGQEEQKSGVLPSDLSRLLMLCEEQGLKISGLMCIPPQQELPSLHFALLANLAKRHHLPYVSMGMSGDFEQAVAQGATHIRLGTAIFGSRS